MEELFCKEEYNAFEAFTGSTLECDWGAGPFTAYCRVHEISLSVVPKNSKYSSVNNIIEASKHQKEFITHFRREMGERIKQTFDYGRFEGKLSRDHYYVPLYENAVWDGIGSLIFAQSKSRKYMGDTPFLFHLRFKNMFKSNGKFMRTILRVSFNPGAYFTEVESRQEGMTYDFYRAPYGRFRKFNPTEWNSFLKNTSDEERLEITWPDSESLRYLHPMDFR